MLSVCVPDNLILHVETPSKFKLIAAGDTRRIGLGDSCLFEFLNFILLVKFSQRMKKFKYHATDRKWQRAAQAGVCCQVDKWYLYWST